VIGLDVVKRMPVRPGWRGRHLRLGAGICGVAPFGVDELTEPADLALGGLLTVALEGRRVGVEALAAAGCGFTHALEVLLDPRATALEDAQAHVALGTGEEREPHVEAVVLVGRGVGAGDEPGEVLLAGCRQLVHDPGSPTARAGRVGRLGDETVVEQVAQGGVERAVGQRAERAERGVETTAQVVTVGGALVEEAEDSELQQLGAAALHGRPPSGGTDQTYGAFVRSKVA
jgi:hypothetical protein